RVRCDERVRAAVDAGATIVAGGRPLGGPGWFYHPTVLTATSAEPETALAGIFGPVGLIRGVSSAGAAGGAANAGPSGLRASVWGGNRRIAKSVACRLEAGMVTVNDAVTPTGHAASPFGGIKASGFGRTHGLHGLREFTSPRALLARGSGGFRP